MLYKFLMAALLSAQQVLTPIQPPSPRHVEVDKSVSEVSEYSAEYPPLHKAFKEKTGLVLHTLDDALVQHARFYEPLLEHRVLEVQALQSELDVFFNYLPAEVRGEQRPIIMPLSSNSNILQVPAETQVPLYVVEDFVNVFQVEGRLPSGQSFHFGISNDNIRGEVGGTYSFTLEQNEITNVKYTPEAILIEYETLEGLRNTLLCEYLHVLVKDKTISEMTNQLGEYALEHLTSKQLQGVLQVLPIIEEGVVHSSVLLYLQANGHKIESFLEHYSSQQQYRFVGAYIESVSEGGIEKKYQPLMPINGLWRQRFDLLQNGKEGMKTFIEYVQSGY